ncbi:MAG: hypothetical protein ACO3VF_10050 [Tamlana sp.]|jgi:hypothetical protein
MLFGVKLLGTDKSLIPITLAVKISPSSTSSYPKSMSACSKLGSGILPILGVLLFSSGLK